MADVPLYLRPFMESDLDLLARFATDPTFSAPFEWTGFRSPASYRRRWEEDTFLEKDPYYLAIARTEETALGWVMWRQPDLGGLGRGGSVVWEVGALLAPEHRGKGIGSEAQRLLVKHLFDTTAAHRICAFTDADNAAEQRALEKCRFQREGLLREAGCRRGRWRDMVVYGLLREDHAEVDDEE